VVTKIHYDFDRRPPARLVVVGRDVPFAAEPDPVTIQSLLGLSVSLGFTPAVEASGPDGSLYSDTYSDTY
jgi:hypothetical protein